MALVLAALAGGALLSALDVRPLDLPHQRALIGHAGWLALLAAGFSLWVLLRQSQPDERRIARPTTVLSLVTAGAGLFFVSALLSANGHHGVSRNESRALADVRTVISAQAAYQTANSGYFDSDLSCLAHPDDCLPEYGADQPAFLEDGIASLGPRSGYRRSFHPGLPPEEIRLEGSPTSVSTWGYLAAPSTPGYSGVRGFCGDSSGRICFTADGNSPPLREDGTCDLERCSELQ